MSAWTLNLAAYLITFAGALLWTLMDKPVVACVFLLVTIAGFCAQIADNTKP